MAKQENVPTTCEQALPARKILLNAIKAGNTEMVEQILQHHPQLASKPLDDPGNTALHFSVTGQLEIFSTLVAFGAAHQLNALNTAGQSPLALAIEAGIGLSSQN